MLRRRRQKREQSRLRNAAAPIHDPYAKQELEDTQLPPHHSFSPVELTSERPQYELFVDEPYQEMAAPADPKVPVERVSEL